MTLSPQDSAAYQKIRLWSGISTITANLAFVWLAALGAPTLSTLVPVPYAVQLMLVVFVGTALVFPLEFLSGHMVETLVGRTTITAKAWCADWLRGVPKYLVPMFGAAMLFALGSSVPWNVKFSALGIWAGVLLLVGLLWKMTLPKDWFDSSVTLEYEQEIQRECRQLGIQPPKVEWIDSGDSTATGSSPNFIRLRSIILSSAVARNLTPREVALMVAREHYLVKRGWKAGTLAISVAWLSAGLLLALWLTSGLMPLQAGLVGIASVSTWSLLALFVWPHLNRSWSQSADLWLATRASHAEVEALVKHLQEINCTDVELPAAKRRVFHPIPPSADRVRQLQASSATAL